MKENHTIINGDSRQMKELANNSVQLAITSPPYWQLKDYGIDKQIGYNEDYETYINNLNLVWQECHRVLENGCRLCINIGDQFARAASYGRYKVIPIRTEIIKFCETIGFDYMGAIIWQKKTTTNTTGGASIMGSFPFPRNGILSIDYEFILLFKKLGDPLPWDRERREKSRMSKEEWREYFAGHWNFGGTKQDDHIAMFPEELPKRLIKMFSFVGDTVLDPFLGSGTTSLAAKNNERNSVGYEVNSDFIPNIRKKLEVDQLDFANTTYEFITRNRNKVSYTEEIKKFPYIFNDPHKFNSIQDPKKGKYGSKIDKNSEKREEYFSVKELISPELIRLNNGETVRLIGIRERKDKLDKALQFLKLKTRSRVYLRYDKTLKRDQDNNLWAYLYMRNKTFINAHLIKRGLVDVDTSYEHKNGKKFIKLEEKRKEQAG